MNNKEASMILSMLKAAYPNTYRDIKPADAKAVVVLWERILKDYGYADVESAVMAFIAKDTKGFSPAPGQIISLLVRQKSEELTDGEARALVLRAVKNSAWHAEEEFEKLPNLIKSAVGSHEMLREWATTDASTFQSVILSNFSRTYRAKVEAEKEFKALPIDVREKLERSELRLVEESA